MRERRPFGTDEITIQFGHGVTIAYGVEGSGWYEEKRHSGQVRGRSLLRFEDVLGRLGSSWHRERAIALERLGTANAKGAMPIPDKTPPHLPGTPEP